jgi:hypothetical protein
MCQRGGSGAALAFSARLDAICKATGLSKEAIINARRELKRIRVISSYFDAGPGGSYQFTVLNSENGLFPLDWNVKPWPRFFSVPYISIVPRIYADRWTGTAALVYDALCEMMSKSGKNELQTDSHWFEAVSKNTLRAAEELLEQTGFIRVKNRAPKRIVEILHPETSQSMPPRSADGESPERAYYIDSHTSIRRPFTERGLTPEMVEIYFRKSLPRSAEWLPGQNAHCPFHDDQTPSLWINLETS